MSPVEVSKSQTNIGSKEILTRTKLLGLKKLVKKINLYLKNFELKHFLGSNKITGQKVVGPKKHLFLKNFWVKKSFGSKDPKKLDPKSSVKIGLVTPEILLIWTNVARTYVAWTNLTMTVGIF